MGYYMKAWSVKSFLSGLLIGVAGMLVLDYSRTIDTVSGTTAFGRFFPNQPLVRFEEDGRLMTTQSDFAFSDPANKVWLAPAESVIDGASIPRSFWTIIGGPFEGPYRNASILHDVACDQRKERSEDVHRMFYFACRCGGVDERKAKMMYFAVARFGPQWKFVYEQLTTPDGQEITVSKPVGIAPVAPPTDTELTAIRAYFDKNNPSVESIQTLEIVPSLRRAEPNDRSGEDGEASDTRMPTLELPMDSNGEHVDSGRAEPF